MTRLIHLGAEAGHDHAEGLVASTTAPTYDTTIKRTGTRAWKFDASGSNVQTRLQYDFSGATGVTYWIQAAFYVPSSHGFPSTDQRILRVLNSGGVTDLCGLELTTGGTLRLVSGNGDTDVGSDSAAVSLDTWFRATLKIQIGAGATDVLEGFLDGVSFQSSTGLNFTDTAPGAVRFGWCSGGSAFTLPGANKLLYVDDFVVQNNAGSVNNTVPGDEKILLLLPTADAEVDGWQGGAGGTSNLFEAVNNIPPVGVDNGSATDTSQIECANADTTDNYDATMQTYTAAGVPSGATITAVYAVAEGGNSSTTGSDTLGLSVISNPAISETVFSIDVNDNTYPTGWNRGMTAVSENPTVTLGTAPVMRVRKGVATTRQAAVCQMAMVVSYVEGSGSEAVTASASTLSLGNVAQTIQAGSAIQSTASTLSLGSAATSALSANVSTQTTTSTLTLEGSSPTIAQSHSILGSPSSLSLAGGANVIEPTTFLAPSASALSLAGVDQEASASSSVSGTPTTLALSGVVASAATGSSVLHAASSLALSGIDAIAEESLAVAALPSAISLDGPSASVSIDTVLSPFPSSLSLGGVASTVSAGSALGATPSSLSLGGNASVLHVEGAPSNAWSQGQV